jgi:hypothetical protein
VLATAGTGGTTAEAGVRKMEDNSAKAKTVTTAHRELLPGKDKWFLLPLRSGIAACLALAGKQTTLNIFNTTKNNNDKK